MQTTHKQTEISRTPSLDSQFTGVPSEYLADVFPEIEWMFNNIADRSGGRHTVRSLLDMILDARVQLWMSVRNEKPEAVALSQISTYPDSVVCNIFAAVGHNSANWLHFLEEIEGWAKDRGCTRVEAVARPGWARRLPKEYKKTHVVMEKVLNDA